MDNPVETPKNVLPFRPLGEPRSGEPKSGEPKLDEPKLDEPKSPVLTPVENSAFNELARQLSARLESERCGAGGFRTAGHGD